MITIEIQDSDDIRELAHIWMQILHETELCDCCSTDEVE